MTTTKTKTKTTTITENPQRTLPTPPPIVFLDIDGVLNRTKHATHIRLEADLVERFQQLVHRTKACIVLSTFWRHFREYIAYILDRHGISASLVIGVTPGRGHNKQRTKSLSSSFSSSSFPSSSDATMLGRSSEDESEYTSRAEEIRAWLKAHPGHDRFVILDDRPSAVDDDSLLQDHFVLCNTAKGLTQEDVDNAIEILSSTTIL